MPNLPINISNAAPAPISPKQPGIDSANQQDEQGFSDVLARQVNDSGKQSPSTPSSEEKGKRVEEQENTETSPVMETTMAASADMLATLLTQQNPAATPRPDAHPQFAPDAPENIPQAGQIIPDLRNKQSVLPATANLKSDKMSTELLADPALGKLDNPVPGKFELTDNVKTSAAKDAATNINFHAQRTNLAAELTPTAPSAPQLAIPLPAVATPYTPTTINTPVTQPAWGDEFGQTITWMATQRNQSAELHLNPPQLGPLDVSLKMNGDQATALFTSPHAAVRDAIEQALPRLREMLAENGIMLNNAMVSDQSAKNNQDNASRKSQGKLHSESADNAMEVNGIPETRISSISRHHGMVDTFA
jgi:flagellar hook-length control protein FliK